MRHSKSLVLLLSLLSLAGGVMAQQIVNLDVAGQVNADPLLVLSASGLETGTDLKPVLTRNAIKGIYRLGLFSDVSIDTATVPGGVNVVIHVKEFPVVSSVEYMGNKKISDDKLQEEVKALEGEIASPQRILAWKRKVISAYQEKGYLLAKVDERLTSTEEGRVKVDLVIEEGRRLRIKQIEIVGNEKFPDNKIEMAMKNREKAWYRSGSFNEEEFQNDPDRIVDFYRRRGYAECQVTDQKTTYDDSKEWMYITLTVEEGKRFRIGDISYKGNSVFRTEALQGAMKYKSGDVYNSGKMESSLMEMYSIFGEGGYIYASVVPHESVRSDTLVDVEYEIVEGNPAHMRKIDIEGNHRTREKVIRREIGLMPGKIFKRSLLVKSQRSVFNLGFFEDVLLDSKTVNEQGDIDLVFQVKEKPTGQIGMGVAYSAVDKLTGYLTLSIPNLMGMGESSYIKLETGEKKKNVEIGFMEPWLFDTPLSAGLDLFYVTRERIGYTDKHVGGSVTASRPVPRLEYTKAYCTYTLESVEYNVDDPTKVGSYILSQIGKRTASTARVTLVRDSRDNFFNATMGTRNMIMGEFSGGYLGGQVRYQKYEAESRWYHPLIWKNAIMFRAREGYVDGYRSGETVPISERFLLGGVGDWGLRGYSDFGYDIGPRDRFHNPLGGKVALVLNAEYKIFLAKGVYWLLFADAGNIWEGLKEVELNSRDDLKKGAGFGIRLEIPMMGVMGFDFAYGFDQKEPSWQPHFQIGTSF